MGKIDDGGPAFPFCGPLSPHRDEWGMSLRDWFAGQALAGLLSRSTWSDEHGTEGVRMTLEGKRAHHAEVVAVAMMYADAMLAARESKP